MPDDFDAHLRRCLHAEADRWVPPQDLETARSGLTGRIRRRRRAQVVALIGVVAVALLVGVVRLDTRATAGHLDSGPTLVTGNPPNASGARGASVPTTASTVAPTFRTHPASAPPSNGISPGPTANGAPGGVVVGGPQSVPTSATNSALTQPPSPGSTAVSGAPPPAPPDPTIPPTTTEPPPPTSTTVPPTSIPTTPCPPAPATWQYGNQCNGKTVQVPAGVTLELEPSACALTVWGAVASSAPAVVRPSVSVPQPASGSAKAFLVALSPGQAVLTMTGVGPCATSASLFRLTVQVVATNGPRQTTTTAAPIARR
jgi:hypothetical protein